MPGALGCGHEPPRVCHRHRGRLAGGRLLFFYAWQKADGLAQLPGHGPTDFKPWLRALRDIGYHRFVNPFMHGDVEPGQMAAALVQSRTYLKALA